MTAFLIFTALAAWLGFFAVCGMLFIAYLILQGRSIL